MTQVDTTQVGTTQVCTTQVCTTQVRTTQVNLSKIETSKVSSLPFTFDIINESSSRKISFSSSVSVQHFINSHLDHMGNFSFTDIYSVAQILWQTPTQLDINFQITDLPTGQLAETTITGFNEQGIPNAGTIQIDHDANGLGWFIDRTPLDNSEFIPQNTDTYLLAAAESEAYGKYDLLTTVLHEMAHLYGFIDGYVGFDALIDSERLNNNFTISLDGSHLDKEAHPNDLLNTHLAPGVRKLPSELNVEILQAILEEQEIDEG